MRLAGAGWALDHNTTVESQLSQDVSLLDVRRQRVQSVLDQFLRRHRAALVQSQHTLGGFDRLDQLRQADRDVVLFVANGGHHGLVVIEQRC